MLELLIRPTGLDIGLMRKILTPIGAGNPTDLVIHPRLVVDAVTAVGHPQFADIARVAGVPMLIDPDTFYLQDHQPPADQWAGLPYARPGVLTVSELTRTAQRDLVESAVDFQLSCGSTHLITPYLHVRAADDGWADRQLALYRTMRTVLDERGTTLPTVAVLDLGWRLLDRADWSQALTPLLGAIETAGFDEIALAGSNVDGGAHPEDRAATLLACVRRAARSAPVIAWNQGLLGELCIAAGAVGYGTGIGWRERWDAASQMRDRRALREPGPRTARPVYIDRLGRSIPKATVRDLASYRSIAPDLLCPPGRCCSGGVQGLLGDSRQHTLHARVASLRRLAETDQRFRWSQLRTRAELGLDLAHRINRVADRAGLSRVNDASLRSIAMCSATAQEHRRVHAA